MQFSDSELLIRNMKVTVLTRTGIRADRSEQKRKDNSSAPS
jgi:hypothetical protein